MRYPVIEYTCDLCSSIVVNVNNIFTIDKIDICFNCCQILEKARDTIPTIDKVIEAYQEKRTLTEYGTRSRWYNNG